MKTVPIALLTHKAQPATTLSNLVKIGPFPSGAYLRMTSLDVNEVYDDGEGPETYYAHSGADLSSVISGNDMSVENAEFNSLLDVLGITEEMVRQGQLDAVRFIAYEHNYRSTVQPEHEIISGGVIGQVRLMYGMLVIPELRSWTQLLKQNGLVSETSVICRVRRFGSQPGEEREWCGYALAYEWIPATVTSVGTEEEREFTASGLGQATDYFKHGLVTWTTGNNAGTSVELESFTSGGIITLRFLCRAPVEVGDQFEIRRGCSRAWTGHNSCDTYFGSEKGAHFRGEPNIGIGNSMENSIPGVTAGNTYVGTGE